MNVEKIKNELVEQKKTNFKGNLYHYSQVNFAYNSNKTNICGAISYNCFKKNVLLFFSYSLHRKRVVPLSFFCNKLFILIKNYVKRKQPFWLRYK